MSDDALSFADRRAQALGAAVERELVALREQLVEAEARLAETPDLQQAAMEGERQRERAEALQRKLDDTTDELVDTHDQLRRARDELDVLRRSIQGIESSASWRLTAPLRAAKGRVRRSPG